MCQINNSKKLVASKNITVYVVRKKEYDIYFSPYHHTQWKLNNIMRAKPLKTADNRKQITKGFFHSFEKLKDVKTEVNFWDSEEGVHVILKAIIPKETTYIKGYYDDFITPKRKTYASTHLILIEEI
jgi:hypothetical protein